MIKKLISVAVVLAFISSIGLASAQTGYAAEIETTGPNVAAAPAGDWVGLEPDQEVWYVFNYDYDSSRDTISEALVELEMGSENSVSFEVWTAEQVEKWATGTDFDALGIGARKSDFTGNHFHDTKLIWANGAAASERFYVIVKNDRDVASYYNLDISGTGISFPTVAESPAVDVAAVDTGSADEILTESLGLVVEGVTVEVPDLVGVGPDTALVATNEWTDLAPGEKIWYAFTYDFDQHASTPSDVLVQLEMGNENSVGFEIWTPDQVNKWGNGTDFDPLGLGAQLSDFTLNDAHDTKLTWSSNTLSSDTYYVIVENQNATTSYFALDITGKDVSW